MKLNINERFGIISILPKQGSIIELRVAKPLTDKVFPTDDELKAVNGKKLPNGSISWDETLDKEKEIEFGLKEEELICDKLKEIEKQKQLSMTMVTLWEKFIERKGKK